MGVGPVGSDRARDEVLLESVFDAETICDQVIHHGPLSRDTEGKLQLHQSPRRAQHTVQ